MNEIYSNSVKSTTISISNSKIHSIRNKTINSTGLRVYQDNCIGVSGAQGKADLSELERKANEMLKMMIPYPYEPCKERKEAVEKKNQLPKDFDLVIEVNEILALLNSKYPDFIISHQASYNEVESSLSNDKGLDLLYKDSFLGLGLVFKEKTSANIMDGFFGYGGREYDREVFVKYYTEILKAYKTRVELPDKKEMPVIFTTDGSITSKLNSDLSGLQIGTGSSLLTSHIGRDKFHKDLTIWQSHNPDDGLLPFFDMEGMVNPNYRVALIENGKILNGYTDKQIAAKYKLPYTGCATGAYDSIPKLGAAALQMKPSDKRLKELLNGELGVYVYISSGGDFTSNGEYGAPVQLAFLTDGENLLGRLPELNISSNLFNMFGSDYIGVSKEKIYPHDFAYYLAMNMKVSKIY